MKKGRKCNWLIAVITAFVTILIISYVSGYTIGNWTVTSWLSAVVIVVIAVFCTWCNWEDNAENDK